MSSRKDRPREIDPRERIFLESIGEGVCVLDPEGRTVFANRAAAELTGYKPEELVGEVHHELLRHSRPDGTHYSPEDCPLCGAFREGKVHKSSNEVFWGKDGTMLPVGYTSDPILEDGETTGAIVIFRDVSARRRASEEMEQRFKKLLEESGEGLVLTEDGKVFDANKSFLESFGYRYDEVIGMEVGAFVVPEERETVVRQVFSSSMETYEARGLRKDGTTFPMQVQPRNFPYGDREVRLTSVLDITERKEAEEELQRQKDLYEGILAAQSELGEGFIIVEDQSITYANEAFCEISGYSPEEIKNTASFLDLVPEEDRAYLIERRQRRMETGEGDSHYETGIRRKDGGRTDVEVAFKVFENETPPKFMIVVRDTSRRKKAEAELQSSEEQYRSLFETMTQGVVYQNDDGSISAANPAAQEILGLSLDQMQGKTSMDPRWRAIREDGTELPGEEHPAMVALRTGEKVEGEIMGVFVPERGEYRWLRVDAVPQFEAGESKPYRVYAILDDITGHRLAEENLRKQERRFRRLVEQAADALFVHDLQGDIVDVNHQACASLGYTREELLSMTVADIEQNIVPGGFESLWSDVLSGGPVTIEGVHRRKDGTAFPVEIRIGLFEAEEGQLMLAAARDITGRREAEEKLRRNERSLVEAQRIASFGNWEYDLREDEARWSEELYRIFGHEPQEFVPKYRTFFEAVHPEDRKAVREAAQAALAIDSGSGIDFRVVRPGGEVRIVHAIYEVVRFMSGRPQKLVGTVHDVTERKQYEDELQRSNAELEQFAYVASHDLQEPLRMVSSYTQLLGRRYKGQLDEDAEEFIDYAVDGAERMQRLINDLLSYSRVGTRGRELAPTELSVVMEAAMANLRLAIEENDAQVTSDTLPTITGDRPQLMQLFQNLIGNAIKFRGEESPEVHVGAERQDGEWLISVRDNGIGLDPEYADRVFVIFQRLHGRREYEGTGIGLAVCKRIVERHGGRIWVESTPGAGSTFYFTLPDTGEPRE
jgi:PAS domain S-box-containing protein